MKGKMGRPKLPDSIDTLGRVVIAVDRPCRNDLKALARANHMTLVSYLRSIAEQEFKLGTQATIPGLPARKRNIEVENMVAEMAALRESYNGMELAICWLVRQFTDRPLNTGIRGNLKSFAEWIRTNPDAQGELKM